MKPSFSPGQIRLIGGQWRGRKLPVLVSDGLRPTTDRIRETLFNWLMPIVQQARCLDCFAGSGALGLEALSRQAAFVTLLERDPAVARQLKQNLAQLHTRQAEVIVTNALTWLAKSGTAYDIIFLDPPFRQGQLAEVIPLLETQGWLAPNAMIYIENSTKEGPPVVPANWQLWREKMAGQVAYRLYQRVTDEKNEETDHVA